MANMLVSWSANSLATDRPCEGGNEFGPFTVSRPAASASSNPLGELSSMPMTAETSREEIASACTFVSNPSF